jgi:hypothetical protein
MTVNFKLFKGGDFMQVLNLRVALVALMILAAFALIGSNVLAKNENQNGTRPGWGFGDQNHTHTGPPGGPSVHPVHGS